MVFQTLPHPILSVRKTCSITDNVIISEKKCQQAPKLENSNFQCQ